MELVNVISNEKKFSLLLIFLLTVVLSIPSDILAQEVSGTVTEEETGEPLPGVNVVVQGTTTGTATDADGSYSLTVPSLNDTLNFSFIGYRDQKVAINGRTEINIKLQSQVFEEEELVVVGYGKEETKVKTVGAARSIEGSSVSEIPSPNVSQSLAGKLPGVSIIGESGQVGEDQPTILIRGQQTLNNNSPLYVIDGVPTTSGDKLSHMNPNDIKNITVIKDATAAIYGSRAANGVILVQTKRGKSGPPQLSVKYNQGIAMPTRIAEVADAPTFMRMLNEVDQYRNRSPRYSPEEIKKYENADQQDPWLYHNTDWVNETIKNAVLRSNGNLSISGGGDDITYNASLGTKRDNGVIINSQNKYRQYNFRNNLDAYITDNLSLKFDVSGRWEHKNYAPISGKYRTSLLGNTPPFSSIHQTPPTLRPFWPNGKPGPAVEKGLNPAISTSSATGSEQRDTYYLQPHLQLNYDMPSVEGLSLRFVGAYELKQRRIKSWYTPWTLYTFDETSYKEKGGDPEQYLDGGERGPSNPQLNMESNRTTDIFLNGIAEYKKDIRNHSLDVTVGTEYLYNQHSYFAAYREGFISDLLPDFFAGDEENQNIRGGSNHGARLNYFTRVNYSYQDKYLLELVGRADGSYIFPKGHRYGFFPSIAGGWRLSEEKFLKDSFFDELKITASWGKTGNDRVSPYQFLKSYNFGQGYYFSPDGKERTIYPGVEENPEITWEVSKQLNIGISGEILSNRLSFEVNTYRGMREDILTKRNASVPRYTGLSLPSENIGKVKSWGYDGSISWKDNINYDLSYNIRLNGGYATNRIEFWDEPPGAPEWQKSTGHKMNTALRYEAIGVFHNQEEVDNYPHWSGARPGDLIFKDVNDDGKIDGDDRVRAKRNHIPAWTGGLIMSASYKQFDFLISFKGAAGASEYVVMAGGDQGNYYKEFAEKRWTPENPEADGPRAFNRNEEYWKEHGNTYFWRKKDYLRLKEAQISYELPSKSLKKIGLEKGQIYLNGFNLFTLTNFIGDPESNNVQSGYPQLKTFNLGIKVSI